MRIEKCRAACGQLVDMWRLRQWMPTQVPDPVVLVIDGDEEDVGLLLRSTRAAETKREQAKDRAESNHEQTRCFISAVWIGELASTSLAIRPQLSDVPRPGCEFRRDPIRSQTIPQPACRRL